MFRSMMSVAAAAMATALTMGSAAQAAQVTIKFDGTQGVTSSLRFSDHFPTGGENGGSNFNHNTGGQQGLILASLPEVDWFYPITLFRANLSSVPANSTINSVQFVVGNSWWNAVNFSNVEIRQIQVPGGAAWQPGNGNYAERNTAGVQDAGAGQWFANLDPATSTGVAWDGIVKDTVTARGYGTYANTAAGALTTLLASGTLDGGLGTNTFSGSGLNTLVQGWVNGTTANEGFALSLMNATNSGGSATNLFSMLPDGTGLVIDYTPIPEPASLSLLALGGLAMLRRRSR